MTSTQCAICGNKEQLAVLYKETINKKRINATTFSARRTPDRMHYRFVKCLNCGLIFSNPIFPPKNITSLYKESTFDYDVESTYLRKTYGEYLLRALPKKKTKDVSLLDIGCGNGFFLEEAREVGVGNVYGVEPGRESVKKAPKWLQKNITVDIFKKGQFKANTFDIVCCFHTLDHIVDPNEFLKNVYSILKKEGRAYFVVHDTAGLSVRLFGEKSPIFDIEHIYLFNQKNLAMLFKKNGFNKVETFQVKNKYPLNYWVRMVPLPRVFKLFALSIIEKLSLANVPISMRAGNIGIIAEK